MRILFISLTIVCTSLLALGSQKRVPAKKAPPSHHSEYAFHGKYKLQNKSDITESLELSDVIIKDVPSDEKVRMIITLFPGLEFSEVNAPVYWNKTKEKFVFKLDRIEECQDYDCQGLGAMEGELVYNKDYKKRNVRVKATFFRDIKGDGDVKEWTETLIFSNLSGDGSYSF